MLRIIRENKTSLIGTIIIGILIFLMLGFGVGSFSGPGKEGLAATVNDQEISFENFYRQRETIERNFQNQFGANYSEIRKFLNLDQQTSDYLIQDVLLQNFTEDLGLTASKKQIEQDVMKSPFFANGFSKQQYQAYLNALGLSGAAFESLKRKEFIRSQLQSIFADLSFTSDQELRAIYNNKKSVVSYRYLTIDPEAFKDKVTSDDEKLKAFYQKNVELYRKPRAVKFSYVEFKPEDYRNKVELVDEDLFSYYQERREEFYLPAKVKLRQIALKKAPKEENLVEDLLVKDSSSSESSNLSSINSDQAKKQLATQYLEEIQAGKDFVELAKSASEDSSTKNSGGDLGWKTLTELDESIRNAINELEPGEVSNVIETEDEFLLVYLDEKVDREPKAFETVRDQLKKDLELHFAPAYAQADAEAFLSKLENKAGNVTFEEAVKEANKPLIASEKALTQFEEIPGAPAGLTKEVINFAEGEQQLLNLGDSTFIVKVIQAKESYIQDFSEVKPQVLAAYVESSAKEEAKKAAELILAKLKDDKTLNLKNIAEQHGHKITETPPSPRDQLGDPLFSNPEIHQEALSLRTVGQLTNEALMGNGKYYLIELASIVNPEDSEFSKEKPTLLASEQTAANSRLSSALLSYLKSKAEIWVNPVVIQNNG
jgi:peptidyl-prolyl cis-trans isomerase D